MLKHFELTNQTIKHDGRTLYRIRATKDLPQHKVKAGDLGGFVESMYNLDGNAWVTCDAMVYGNAKVYGDALISDAAKVYGNAEVYGNVVMYDVAKVCGDAKIDEDIRLYDDVKVYGNADYSTKELMLYFDDIEVNSMIPRLGLLINKFNEFIY